MRQKVAWLLTLNVPADIIVINSPSAHQDNQDHITITGFISLLMRHFANLSSLFLIFKFFTENHYALGYVCIYYWEDDVIKGFCHIFEQTLTINKLTSNDLMFRT